MYLVDTVSLRFVARRAGKSSTDFVIFDRYIYDELANLSLRNPASRLYARLIIKLAPTPHLSYLLDANPVEARARKPEYPIEFLHQNRASYLALNQAFGVMTIIPPMPVEAMQREIWKHLVSLLSPPERESGRMLLTLDTGIPSRSEEQDAFPTAL